MDPELEEQAKDLLSKDTKVVPEFKQNKLLQETTRNWDLFYKRNTTNFFKDRHWTDREFEELRPTSGEPCSKKLLEIGKHPPPTIRKPISQHLNPHPAPGCGVGNFVFPLLDLNPELFIYACDFSKRAVEFVQADPRYTPTRSKAFVCDLTQDALTDNVPAESLDLISAIFMLSAVAPDKQANAIQNMRSALKPGGVVLFRDYGLYDAAQLRFKPGSKMKDQFYVRQDGTFAYYFSTEQLSQLFVEAGFEVLENEYVCKEVVNRKRELSMQRIFVQARFRKV
ncbi:Methyltransferase-like protein 6 [Rhizophlyctis rosea]|nr:Methyltransferase-like protein 6 [Rhizophlyctis rosea]